MKYVFELVEILVSIVLFGAFFPQINSAITSIGLDNVTISGTAHDFSWVGYILVIGLLVGLMYLGINQLKKTKGK